MTRSAAVYGCERLRLGRRARGIRVWRLAVQMQPPIFPRTVQDAYPTRPSDFDLELAQMRRLVLDPFSDQRRSRHWQPSYRSRLLEGIPEREQLRVAKRRAHE
jgi:hypothetical protein